MSEMDVQNDHNNRAEAVQAAFDRPVTLHRDGPTLAEYVAAGYQAENYPPPGYAVRDEAAPRVVVIERGPWEVDLDAVLSISIDDRGVIVATSKGGFVLSSDEAAPIIEDQARRVGDSLKR